MKKKFKFTTKTSKEAIATIEAETSQEALSFFAKTKKMSEDAFLEIFNVSEVEPKVGKRKDI